MRIKVIDELPKRVRKSGYDGKHVYNVLMEFMGKHEKLGAVILEDGEYSLTATAYFVLKNAVATYKLPIIVEQRNGEFYLIRSDM